MPRTRKESPGELHLDKGSLSEKPAGEGIERKLTEMSSKSLIHRLPDDAPRVDRDRSETKEHGILTVVEKSDAPSAKVGKLDTHVGGVVIEDPTGETLAHLQETAKQVRLTIGREEGESPGRIALWGDGEIEGILLEGKTGTLSFFDQAGNLRGYIKADANGAFLQFLDASRHPYAFLGDTGQYSELALGGKGRFPGRVTLWSGDWVPKIVLDAEDGDIMLLNADCAEEFELEDPTVEPGTVLVLADEPGRLRTSDASYDSRVAGVVSGGGNYRPGIVLDRKSGAQGRRPVALLGKVYCKVEAHSAPIEPGTLLTTSGLAGHAMAARDRDRGFGAVLGKALAPLTDGVDLLPVLVALQ